MDVLKKSAWIWTDENYEQNQPIFILFRKEVFTADKSVIRGRITADSCYRLVIDGEDILDGPCKGNGEVTYYDEFERKLEKGTHCICVTVVHYPQSDNTNSSVWRTTKPGLYFTSAIESEKGETYTCNGDETWKCHIEKKHSFCKRNFLDALGVGEIWKQEKSTEGWMHTNFDTSCWRNARPYLDMEMSRCCSPGNLKKRPVPYLFRKINESMQLVCVRDGKTGSEKWKQFLKGASLKIPAHSKEIVEFGTEGEITAYMKIAVRGGYGAEIKIISSEGYGYKNDGPGIYGPGTPVLPIKGDRTDYKNGYLEGVTDRVIITARENARQIFRTFFYRACRYLRLEIETKEEALCLKEMTLTETGYPLEVKACVKTSDPDMEKIWEMSLRTLRCCMHDTYIDCPFYERKQYILDARLEALYTYTISGDNRLGKQALEMFAAGQRADGLLYCCYPSVEPNVIPDFSLYYVLMLHDYMMYFGEKDFLSQMFPHILKIFSFFEKRVNENGLYEEPSAGGLDSRYWCFVDWAKEWDAGVPKAIEGKVLTFSNLLLAYAYQKASEIADYLDAASFSQLWRRKAQKHIKAVKKECCNEKGIFRDGPGREEYSQHVQALSVLTSAASNEKRVLEAALNQKNMVRCSVSMLFYLFRALEKANMYEKTETLWKPWKDMISENLSTCVENDSNKRSDCHGWGALALYELPAVILGVKPKIPGFEEISVQPAKGYFKYAYGTVPIPDGVKRISWTEKNGKTDILAE